MESMSPPEASLANWGEEAEAAWSEFRIDRSSFLEKVRASLPEGPTTALPRLHHIELYLAHACALGERQALTLFTRRYLTKIPHYLRRFSGVEALLDECRTTLEDKLLLSPGTGGRPRIDQYSGRGPLDAWVAIVAQRTMLAMLRSRGAHIDSTSELCDLWSAAYEVEGDAHRYLNVIKETLREVLQSLPLRQRSILRLSIVEDVSLTQIARMLHVNQSTVSRTFHASLEKVNRQVRARLKEAHGMGDSEVESIVRQLQSRIDLSLSGLFAEAPELVASLDRALAQSG
jgi:RNA polymerase sigma-70 factor (ECF subfamily)